METSPCRDDFYPSLFMYPCLVYLTLNEMKSMLGNENFVLQQKIVSLLRIPSPRNREKNIICFTLQQNSASCILLQL